MKKTFLILTLLFLPIFASATTFSLEIDTAGETINAVEGTIVLSQDAEWVSLGNSAILVWINNPNALGREVAFSGITPGGFSGKHTLFNIESAPGLNIVSSQITALRGDGSGTAVPVSLSLQTLRSEGDTAPPEPFEIVIASSPYAYEGERFVSFVAQDKGGGVARYEAATTWLLSPREKSWHEVKSPFVLEGLMNFKRIHIRATDDAGNWRVVSTTGPYYVVNFLVLGAIIVLCVLWFKRRFSR